MTGLQEWIAEMDKVTHGNPVVGRIYSIRGSLYARIKVNSHARWHKLSATEAIEAYLAENQEDVTPQEWFDRLNRKNGKLKKYVLNFGSQQPLNKENK